MDFPALPRPNEAGKYKCHCSKQAGLHYLSRAWWYAHNPIGSASHKKRRRLDPMLTATTPSTESTSPLNQEITGVDISSHEQLDGEVGTNVGPGFDGFIDETRDNLHGFGERLFDNELSADSISKSGSDSDLDSDTSDGESKEEAISELRNYLDAKLTGPDDEDRNSLDEREEEVVRNAYDYEEHEIEDSEAILKRLREVESHTRYFEADGRHETF